MQRFFLFRHIEIKQHFQFFYKEKGFFKKWWNSYSFRLIFETRQTVKVVIQEQSTVIHLEENEKYYLILCHSNISIWHLDIFTPKKDFLNTSVSFGLLDGNGSFNQRSDTRNKKHRRSPAWQFFHSDSADYSQHCTAF